jgi:hypothetical protein
LTSPTTQLSLTFDGWQGDPDLAGTLNALFPIDTYSPSMGQPGALHAQRAARWLAETVGIEAQVELPQAQGEEGAVY